MKAKIRKVVRKIATWPVVGRFVKIGVAVIRLPEFRAEYLERRFPGGAQHDATGQLLANLDHRGLFEGEQLPTLLQAVADINQRQLASDHDRDNLIISAPVALRKLARESNELRAEQKRLENDISLLSRSTDEQLKRFENDISLLSRSAGERVEVLGRQLQAQVEGAAQQAQQVQASANAEFSGVKDSIGYLLGRVEFVRRELMFEMRYGASSPSVGEQSLKAETAIISTEKLEAARKDAIRLNLGCGHIALDGYLNVDRRALPGVDIVAEVDQLPFEANELDEIFSAHLLEHFPQEQLSRQLLPYYFNLLKPGGQFHAVVPDAEAMIREYANGSYPYDDMREVMYGAQDYDGDFHYNMFTPASLSQLLLDAGFVNPTVIVAGRKNGRCYEFEIRADK
jgi:hypothetical protein